MSRGRLKTFEAWQENRQCLLGGWFPGHKADLTTASLGGILMERLVWKKPSTNINRIDYLCDGPHLIVTGDLGDAVYEAGANGLAWWAGISRGSLSYFASKCVASEYGRGYKEWDEDLALLILRDRFAQDGRDGAREWRKLQEFGGLDVLHSEGEWNAWLAESAHEVWGANWSDHEPWGVGRAVALRCEGHLLGLQLALAQLGVTSRAA